MSCQQKKNIKETSEEGALLIFFAFWAQNCGRTCHAQKKACQKRVFRGSWENCPGYVIFLLFLPPPLLPGRNSSSPPHLPLFYGRRGGEQSKALKKLELEEEAQRKKKDSYLTTVSCPGKKNIQGEKNAEEVGESDIG